MSPIMIQVAYFKPEGLHWREILWMMVARLEFEDHRGRRTILGVEINPF